LRCLCPDAKKHPASGRHRARHHYREHHFRLPVIGVADQPVCVEVILQMSAKPLQRLLAEIQRL
jgi:hypothetical protein